MKCVLSVLVLLAFSFGVDSAQTKGKLSKAIPLSQTGDKTEVRGFLHDNDAKDIWQRNCFRKAYRFKMTKGTTYQVEMASEDFDTVLRIENSLGGQWAKSKDTEGEHKVKIRFLAPEADDYYVLVCTTLSAGMKGRFVLTITELGKDGQEKPIVGLIPKAQKPIAFDGKLTDWEGAFVTPVHVGHPDFANRGGQFLYLWDEKNLYIGLKCLDQKPAHIGMDNEIWNGDAVEFYLDTRCGDKLGAAPFGLGTLHIMYNIVHARKDIHSLRT